MRKLIVMALIVLATAAVAGCSTGGGGGGAGTVGGVSGGGGESSRPLEGTVTAQAKPISASSGKAASVPEITPRIVQTASLRLSVRAGDFEDAIDEARSIAAGLGGFVVSSSASQGTVQRLVRGTLVLRVPARSYAEAMKSLAALGRVEGRTEAGQDVSQEYVDLNARVRQLEAVEAQLLQLLDRADTVGAALAVQRELNDAQLELEQAKGRLNYLDDQVAFATVSLAVHERLTEARKTGGGGFSIIDAWSRAANGFLAVIGWTFIVVATAAPLLVLLAVGLLLVRVVRRRLAQA
jgi:hypothetical protein